MILNLLRVFILTGSLFFGLQAQARICKVYLERTIVLSASLTLTEQALKAVEFPPEGRFFIFEQSLRKALYEAYDGKDFYTGLPMAFNEMSIDHVIPRSLGGPDHVSNYVPTTGAINSAKGSSFSAMDLINLKKIQRWYVPKVMDLLKRQGAFENREEIYRLALDASRKKDTYKNNPKPTETQLSFPFIQDLDANIFRRSMDTPSVETQNLLYFFSKELSGLSEKQLGEALFERALQFEVSEYLLSSSTIKKMETAHYYLSARKNGQKLEKEALLHKGKLFEVVEYKYNPKTQMINITLEFHPGLVTKLLEAPQEKSKALQYIKSLFQPLDINKDELSLWSK